MQVIQNNYQITMFTSKQLGGLGQELQRFWKKFPEYEAQCLFQYKEDRDIKTDIVHRIPMDFPQLTDIP